MYWDEQSELGSNAWMMLPGEFLLGFLGKNAPMSHCGSAFRVAEREEAPNFAVTSETEAELKQFPLRLWILARSGDGSDTQGKPHKDKP